eukprot:TRINITY_DN11430_c0_g1_i1.p1 TRINITY_DN11430_c0_g1~~TRINITY_DN11430_c0_g1_i1.p1  ORF type:complete len:734 (-),score=123.90 TRINITY_DN11430_c0_g1_i1:243-2444(-)
MVAKKKTTKLKKIKTDPNGVNSHVEDQENIGNKNINFTHLTNNDHKGSLQSTNDVISKAGDKLLEAIEEAGLARQDQLPLQVQHPHQQVSEDVTGGGSPAVTYSVLQPSHHATVQQNDTPLPTSEHQLTTTSGTGGGTIVLGQSPSVESNYVVEYHVPSSLSEARANNKRKLAESLLNVEDNTTSLKAIKVDFDFEEYDLDCEWSDCSFNSKSPNEFMEHVRQHIADCEVRVGDSPNESFFVCLWEDCGFECGEGNAKEMTRHINYHSHHTQLKCKGLNLIKMHGLKGCSIDTNMRNLFQDLTAPFKCEWLGCDTEFEQPQLFYWHVNRHINELEEEEETRTCEWKSCSKTFKNITRLREHMRSHCQEKSYGCPTCGALFATKTKLLDHLKRQQVTTGSFTCTNCNKTFALERLLRDHMRSHINTYECEECGMCWPTPSSLKNHIMYRHSKTRDFPCESCDYKAKSHHDLKQHSRRHQAEVLSCMEGCGFVCKANSVMKHHFLKVHMKNSPKYACHLCEAVYGRGALLTGHLKKKHKITSTTSRFRYSRDETTGMYRVQLYRFEMQEEEKEADLEIDTEVESLCQASPAASSVYQASPTPSTLHHPSPTPSTFPHPSPTPSSSLHQPSPIPQVFIAGGQHVVDSVWSQGDSVRSQGDSMRSQGDSVRSQGDSVRSQLSTDGIYVRSFKDLGYTYPFDDKTDEQNIMDPLYNKFRSSTPGVEIDITTDEFSSKI